MIIDLLLYIPLYVLGWVIEFFPNATAVNPGLLNYMTEMGSKIRIFDSVIPIDIFYECIFLILIVEGILQGMKVWNYVRTYIPFIH